MTDWMLEHWFVEGIATFIVAGIFVKILCILAELMDKDQ